MQSKNQAILSVNGNPKDIRERNCREIFSSCGCLRPPDTSPGSARKLVSRLYQPLDVYSRRMGLCTIIICSSTTTLPAQSLLTCRTIRRYPLACSSCSLLHLPCFPSPLFKSTLSYDATKSMTTVAFVFLSPSARLTTISP